MPCHWRIKLFYACGGFSPVLLISLVGNPIPHAHFGCTFGPGVSANMITGALAGQCSYSRKPGAQVGLSRSAEGCCVTRIRTKAPALNESTLCVSYMPVSRIIEAARIIHVEITANNVSPLCNAAPLIIPVGGDTAQHISVRPPLL